MESLELREMVQQLAIQARGREEMSLPWNVDDKSEWPDVHAMETWRSNRRGRGGFVCLRNFAGLVGGMAILTRERAFCVGVVALVGFVFGESICRVLRAADGEAIGLSEALSRQFWS